MRLREVDGDNAKEQPSGCESCRLDGQTVTREQLEQAQENQGVRIIETNPGEHKTLHRLRG